MDKEKIRLYFGVTENDIKVISKDTCRVRTKAGNIVVNYYGTTNIGDREEVNCKDELLFIENIGMLSIMNLVNGREIPVDKFEYCDTGIYKAFIGVGGSNIIIANKRFDYITTFNTGEYILNLKADGCDLVATCKGKGSKNKNVKYKAKIDIEGGVISFSRVDKLFSKKINARLG